MLKAKVIGVGAAGNHAAIHLIETGVMNIDDVLLINSTLKDVPEQYKDIALVLTGSEGCAKERNIAHELIMNNLRSSELSGRFDSLMSADDSMVIIVTSAEGGTGSGSSSVIAKYFSEVLGKRVHLTVFGGFEEDARGLKNTVEWFKETNKEYIVDSICNKKFLVACNYNKRKAEQAANEEFAKRVRILLGQTIKESSNNIDDKDLVKLVTTPGYFEVIHGDLGKPKNIEESNRIIKELIDSSKSYDVDATCTRIGVILTISDKIGDNIDYLFAEIKKKFGEPFETFTHIQDIDGINNHIAIIAAGMKMPIDEIEEIYQDYLDRFDAVDKSKDEFFNKEFNTNSDEFDMGNGGLNADQISKNKAAFFGNVIQAPKANFKNIKKNQEDKSDEF